MESTRIVLLLLLLSVSLPLVIVIPSSALLYYKTFSVFVSHFTFATFRQPKHMLSSCLVSLLLYKRDTNECDLSSSFACRTRTRRTHQTLSHMVLLCPIRAQFIQMISVVGPFSFFFCFVVIVQCHLFVCKENTHTHNTIEQMRILSLSSFKK